jgi:cytochrome c oxidase subunit I
VTSRNDRLALAHIGVSVIAFGVASFMALMQALSRAGLDLPWRSPVVFYLSVTAHGVLMALVFTTFFIMGLGVVFTTASLDRSLRWPRFAWVGFWVAVVGTLATVYAILSGQATVLYTFYPPLAAHPAFYIGLTLVVVGSWIWCATLVGTYLGWRRAHPGTPAPLAMFAMLATIAVWCIATIGVAAEMLLLLIPWSLGFVETIDPLLARMLFWYFGHPLVYFWLLPAYAVWYLVAPRIAGGKLFSDPLTRMVFALFIVMSTPVGFHHQFMDPGISAGWKMLHTLLTFGILFPSLVTAFTVTASLELAGRARGGKGLFGWIWQLPWGDPLVASVLLAMVVFALGGIGGAVNASFQLNSVIHNTAWIQGHFHLTVGTASALTFMGTAYWIVPKLLGRDLELVPLAKVQPYLWFVGMLLFSITNHITGLMGMPRRVFETSYGGSPVAAQWEAFTLVSALGGTLLFISAAFFMLVMVFTVFMGRRAEQPAIEFAEPLRGPATSLTVFDRLPWWLLAAAVLVLVAYAYPLIHHLGMTRFGSPVIVPF